MNPPDLPKGYNPVSTQPPDKKLEVIDSAGNRFVAYPTYYPFKVIPTGNGGKWSSKVEPCEPYWDGGWMVSVSLSEEEGYPSSIIGWKELSS